MYLGGNHLWVPLTHTPVVLVLKGEGVECILK